MVSKGIAKKNLTQPKRLSQ